jgi:hypothetical protein
VTSVDKQINYDFTLAALIGLKRHAKAHHRVAHINKSQATQTKISTFFCRRRDARPHIYKGRMTTSLFCVIIPAAALGEIFEEVKYYIFVLRAADNCTHARDRKE